VGVYCITREHTKDNTLGCLNSLHLSRVESCVQGSCLLGGLDGFGDLDRYGNRFDSSDVSRSLGIVRGRERNERERWLWVVTPPLLGSIRPRMQKAE
jgi:hypothetical protein